MAQQKHLGSSTGVAAVNQVVSEYQFTQNADGLEFASPTTTPEWFSGGSVKMSDRLTQFFTDIRLLRRVPLSYLVPDADLLPPESIRFFHVNQTWVDRVIDGVLSTSNIGTVDFVRSLTVLQSIREAFDPAPNGMTGMLIRSELVRRWPTMVVEGFQTVGGSGVVEVLRHEPISRDVYIALFAGEPKRVEVREPFDGVRFGTERPDDDADPDDEGSVWLVDRRTPSGQSAGTDPLEVPMHSVQWRTIDVEELLEDAKTPLDGEPSLAWGGPEQGARIVAIHLEQRPYVQIFASTTNEPLGSVEPPDENDGRIALHNGHTFALNFATHALYGAVSPQG